MGEPCLAENSARSGTCSIKHSSLHSDGEFAKSSSPLALKLILGALNWPRNTALGTAIFVPSAAAGSCAFALQNPITKTLTQPLRIMIFTAATFGVLRIEQLISLGDKFRVTCLALTPRQLAVFRLLSVGMSLKEVAHNLGLSDETAKTHLKKALAKMGLPEIAPRRLRRPFASG